MNGEVGLSLRLKAIISASGLFLLPSGCFFTTCFIRGTRVHTPDGPRPIEDLKVGDEVWSWNTSTQQQVRREIIRLYRGESVSLFRIQAGEFVVKGVTGEHPFWNPAKKCWVKSKDLSVGDAVLAWPGEDKAQTQHITQIDLYNTAENQTVYTLGVDGEEHNYFAEGLLAHNKSMVSPGMPDDHFSTCIDSNEDGKLVHFQDVSVGEFKTKTVRITPNPDCFGPDSGDWMTYELDDPDKAFELVGHLDIPFDTFMEGTGHDVELEFAPPESGEFEAQIRIGFPSTFDEEIQQDLILQLFGNGISNDEGEE